MSFRLPTCVANSVANRDDIVEVLCKSLVFGAGGFRIEDHPELSYYTRWPGRLTPNKRAALDIGRTRCFHCEDHLPGLVVLNLWGILRFNKPSG